jgi:ankyrin repeat protein
MASYTWCLRFLFTAISLFVLTASAQTESKDRNSALVDAILLGQKETVHKLIAEGADVNAPVKEMSNATPLVIAVLKGHKDIAKVLLDKGAKADAEITQGGTRLTLLHLAVKSRDKQLLDLLLSAGANINDNLTDIAAFLLEKGAQVDGRDEGKRTPLHWAALFGHIDVVKMLIAKNADVNAKSVEGRTPLFISQKKGHKTISDLLISHGAKE